MPSNGVSWFLHRKLIIHLTTTNQKTLKKIPENCSVDSMYHYTHHNTCSCVHAPSGTNRDTSRRKISANRQSQITAEKKFQNKLVMIAVFFMLLFLFLRFLGMWKTAVRFWLFWKWNTKGVHTVHIHHLNFSLK